MEQIESKLCNTCGIVKPTSDFNKDRHKRDGLHTMCKSCKRKYRTSDFYSARERELEMIDGHRGRHYKPRNNKYNSSDGGSSYKSEEHHKFRSRLESMNHSLTFDEWNYIKHKQHNLCAICGCSLKLEHDCIIPLSKGGAFEYNNVQAVCQQCNSQKGVKIYMGVSGNRWRRDWIIEPTPAIVTTFAKFTSAICT